MKWSVSGRISTARNKNTLAKFWNDGCIFCTSFAKSFFEENVLFQLTILCKCQIWGLWVEQKIYWRHDVWKNSVCCKLKMISNKFLTLLALPFIYIWWKFFHWSLLNSWRIHLSVAGSFGNNRLATNFKIMLLVFLL
jgi:hypothetical protein